MKNVLNQDQEPQWRLQVHPKPETNLEDLFGPYLEPTHPEPESFH